MWVFEEAGVHKFHLSPHDATPVMLKPDRVETDDLTEPENLQLQPEVIEWLESTPGKYSLWVTPDFIEVSIPDKTIATAFKMRWYGSYDIIELMAGFRQGLI